MGTAEAVVYASPGRRLLGFFIDLVVLSIAALLLLPYFDVSIEELAEGKVPPGWALAYLALFGVYQIGFVAYRGQTLGKIAVRIKVVDANSMALPSLQAAAVRWIIVAAASSLPQIGLVAPLVVYGWLLFDPQRQGVHDKAARTVVIDLLLPTAASLPSDPPPSQGDDDGPGSL
ncbi:MAG: RDD family protein [Acidimicrobiia bacterium]